MAKAEPISPGNEYDPRSKTQDARTNSLISQAELLDPYSFEHTCSKRASKRTSENQNKQNERGELELELDLPPARWPSADGDGFETHFHNAVPSTTTSVPITLALWKAMVAGEA